MIPRPPRSTRTYTRLPYTTLCRSDRRPRHPAFGNAAAGKRPDVGLPVVGELASEGQDDRAALPGHRPGADPGGASGRGRRGRSEEHTSELQSPMRISYAVFCLKTKTRNHSPRHKKTEQ